MSFETEFPGLEKSHINTVPLSYADNIGHCFKFNKRIFDESLIERHCLDKQKVKAVIDEVFPLNDEMDSASIILNARLKKRLGL